ncbi:MAG: transposase, partial [Gemmatimonadota bacterium]|nr:transposase [Gemmatimonadota bacterium]
MANNKGTQRSVATNKSEIVAQVPMACADEAAAILFLEAQRWGDNPHCPRCGDVDVRQMLGKDGERNARFLWRCKGCKSQYTVKVGTVMEDSAIPARH